MVRAPYSGWKQPATSAESASARARRGSWWTFLCGSSHHIDDPLRDDNDLFRAFAVQGPLYRIKRQHGSLNLGSLGIPGHRHVGALLAVNLHRKRYRMLYEQGGFDRRPGLARHQGGVAK